MLYILLHNYILNDNNCDNTQLLIDTQQTVLIIHVGETVCVVNNNYIVPKVITKAIDNNNNNNII